jgi:DNA polymerase-1
VAGAELVTSLRQAGVNRGDLVGLVVSPALGLGLATADRSWPVAGDAGLAGEVGRADAALRPRWVVWSGQTATQLAADGVRLATCWDITAVHRLLFGGWRADPGWAWARLRGLATDTMPAAGPLDLFGMDEGDADDPVAPDGYLRSEWVGGGWADNPDRMARWAALARATAELQRQALAELPGRPMALAAAHCESTAELLCAELSVDGLPMDRAVAERVLASFIGPRPRDEADAAALRSARDAEVLRHAPAGGTADLRSPAQVRALLGRVGVDVPDTRAWRLRELRGAHPLVGALLEWRKAERIATTYGYAWLDEHLGADGRLRGAWTGSDGAAGRMTASAGLHNMPAALRPGVVAADGHVFVRADLGQIEPRVLAAVSRDQALIAATRADDLYAPVAAQLGVDRPTAKVAVLGAMYGQTTGHGAQALRRLNAAYPVAMAYLDAADRSGRAGRDLRTYGGRLIQLADTEARSSSRAAAYGRYARNAMVQGAAAELFKMWAVTVRARCGPLGAQIVLCLHDELLVHCPCEQAETVSGLVDECLREAAARWAPGCGVRFISDTAVIRSWSDAKAAAQSLPGALARAQGLDGLGQAGRAGVRFLGLFHPAHPLLAVGEGQGVEGGPGRVVPGERGEEFPDPVGPGAGEQRIVGWPQHCRRHTDPLVRGRDLLRQGGRHRARAGPVPGDRGGEGTRCPVHRHQVIKVVAGWLVARSGPVGPEMPQIGPNGVRFTVDQLQAQAELLAHAGHYLREDDQRSHHVVILVFRHPASAAGPGWRLACPAKGGRNAIRAIAAVAPAQAS